MEIYKYLQTCSRRAFRRKKNRLGKPYDYRPRANLIDRISRQTGLPHYEVWGRLMQEWRAYHSK